MPRYLFSRPIWWPFGIILGGLGLRAQLARSGPEGAWKGSVGSVRGSVAILMGSSEFGGGDGKGLSEG